MKKSLLGSVILLAILLMLAAWVVYLLLLKNNEGVSNPSNNLSTINYAVQIEYNICYLIIAFVVLIIANSQLNKTREATTIQSLTNIANNLKSESYLKNRSELAKFILDKGKDQCGNFILKTRLKELKELKITDELQNEEIAKIKNRFESVIYDFEILGYYFEKRIYNKEDIYQLFSYEIQYFWVLMEHLGFIDYLRFNEKNGDEDFYDKFEGMFNCTMRHEVLYDDDLTFLDKLPYFFSRYRLSKWQSEVVEKKVLILKEKRQNSIDIFLCEEKFLLLNDDRDCKKKE